MSDQRKSGRPSGTGQTSKPMNSEKFKLILEYIENKDYKAYGARNIIKTLYLLCYCRFKIGEISKLKVGELKKILSRQIIVTNEGRRYLSDAQVKHLREVIDRELSDKDDTSVIRPWGKGKNHYSAFALTRLINRTITSAINMKGYSTQSFISYEAFCNDIKISDAEALRIQSKENERGSKKIKELEFKNLVLRITNKYPRFDVNRVQKYITEHNERIMEEVWVEQFESKYKNPHPVL